MPCSTPASRASGPVTFAGWRLRKDPIKGFAGLKPVGLKPAMASSPKRTYYSTGGAETSHGVEPEADVLLDR